VLIDGIVTASESADIDWVHEIAGMVQGLTFVSSVVGDNQELVQRYEEYKRVVLKYIQQLPGPDPTIVAAMKPKPVIARINGVVICRELQDLKIDLKNAQALWSMSEDMS
jgi:hypothetical protein